MAELRLGKNEVYFLVEYSDGSIDHATSSRINHFTNVCKKEIVKILLMPSDKWTDYIHIRTTELGEEDEYYINKLHTSVFTSLMN